MVASWGCEFTEILTQRSTEHCVKIRVTSQAQLATIFYIVNDFAVSVVYNTLKRYFSHMLVHIVKSFILTVRLN